MRWLSNATDTYPRWRLSKNFTWGFCGSIWVKAS